ncbi:MAG: hypothetical protein HDQ87_01400 [Clostridia bacterium]|nr:hypothetical protein [Clostridia bacterium]
MKQEHERYRQAISAMRPDFEAVRCPAKRSGAEKPAAAWPRWAVPALGAACAAVVVCPCVPSVRASLVDGFSQ